MTTGLISRWVIADRLEMLGGLIRQVKALPLNDRAAFLAMSAMLRLPSRVFVAVLGSYGVHIVRLLWGSHR
jgi:hypothetical protein